MDFGEILDDMQENADDLIHNKPHVLITIIAIVLLFIIGLLIIMVQASPKKKKEVQKILACRHREVRVLLYGCVCRRCRGKRGGDEKC